MKLLRSLIFANLVVVSSTVVILNVGDGVFGPSVSVRHVHVSKVPDVLFPGGDMSNPAALTAWKTMNGAAFSLDTSTSTSLPSSLRLEFKASTAGMVRAELIPVDNQVEILGRIRRLGSVAGDVYVQVKDGPAPQLRLASLALSSLTPRENEWSSFRLVARFPVSYYGAQLVVSAKGSGKLWLDDIQERRLP